MKPSWNEVGRSSGGAKASGAATKASTGQKEEPGARKAQAEVSEQPAKAGDELVKEAVELLRSLATLLENGGGQVRGRGLWVGSWPAMSAEEFQAATPIKAELPCCVEAVAGS